MVEIDVTEVLRHDAAISHGGTLTLALTTSLKAFTGVTDDENSHKAAGLFASRETATPPQLTIEGGVRHPSAPHDDDRTHHHGAVDDHRTTHDHDADDHASTHDDSTAPGERGAVRGQRERQRCECRNVARGRVAEPGQGERGRAGRR